MADQVIAVADFDKQFNHGIGVLEKALDAHIDTETITITLPDNAKVISYKILTPAGVENTSYTAVETQQTIVDGVRTNGTLVLTATGAIDVDSILYVSVNLG